MLWKDESVHQERGRTGVPERAEVPQERGWRDISERQEGIRLPLLGQEERGSWERKLWKKNGDSWSNPDSRSQGQDKKQMDGRTDRAFETQVMVT